MSTPRRSSPPPLRPERREELDRPTVVLCPGGPLLVRGDLTIETEDGEQYRTTRPVSAVCRCGATSRAPWCDGTHTLLPEKARPR